MTPATSGCLGTVLVDDGIEAALRPRTPLTPMIEGAAGPTSRGLPTGTVVFFNDEDGYGFIGTDVSDEDVFFHMDDVGGPDLEEGQDVEFEIVQGDRGPRATDVTRL